MSKVAIVHKESLQIQCIYLQDGDAQLALKQDFPELQYIHLNIPHEYNITNLCVTLVGGQYEITKSYDVVITQLRKKRNELLLQSDWTQNLDSPLTDQVKEQWRLYRQQLRDLPSVTNVENLETIVFPTPPTS